MPIEYGRGVDGNRVTLDFEIQEAVAFATGARGAFDDLGDPLAKRDAQTTQPVAEELDRLQGWSTRPAGAPAASPRRTSCRRWPTASSAGSTRPSRRRGRVDRDSDFDLIQLTLDRMEAAIGAGQHGRPSRRASRPTRSSSSGPSAGVAFDPALTNDIEGLIWFGARGEQGLATLIADRRAARTCAPRAWRSTRHYATRSDAGRLDLAATVVTNAAIIVFREGLEAVLILAAITASFVAARGAAPAVLIGAALGLPCRSITWVAAQTLLTSLSQYGEKLEAVVGLIAIGVLLLITNWFFHKVYWTGGSARSTSAASASSRATGSCSSARRRSGCACSG